MLFDYNLILFDHAVLYRNHLPRFSFFKKYLW